MAFQVSEATIRQDLERLEQEGQITREHGGAFLNTVPAQVGTMTLHHQDNMDQKRKIGALAADLVKDGETIILDAGTTTTEIALRLVNRRNLTVITNALNIAIILGAVPGNAVHMPGGQFKAPTLSLSGDSSVDYFRNIFAAKLFLATAGVALQSMKRRRRTLGESSANKWRLLVQLWACAGRLLAAPRTSARFGVACNAIVLVPMAPDCAPRAPARTSRCVRAAR